MSDDLVKRLQSFSAGCRGSMWQSRDKTISLMDEAASRLAETEAERDRLAREVERLTAAVQTRIALAIDADEKGLPADDILWGLVRDWPQIAAINPEGETSLQYDSDVTRKAVALVRKELGVWEVLYEPIEGETPAPPGD